MEMNKINVKMNNPIHLGLSVLDISKIAMYEYWYDYAKPKYEDDAKLCYLDTDNFIVHIKFEDVYEDHLAGNAETRFDTSKYEETRNHIQKQICK